MAITIEDLGNHLHQVYAAANISVRTEEQAVLLHVKTEDWSFVLSTQLSICTDRESETERPAIMTQGAFLHPKTDQVVTLTHLPRSLLEQFVGYGNGQLNWCRLVAKLPHTEQWPRLVRRDILHGDALTFTQVDDQLRQVFDECEQLYALVYELDQLSAEGARHYLQLLQPAANTSVV